MPQELSKYITYIFVLWKLSHIYPHTVGTGYFSWNKMFLSYRNLEESQKIPERQRRALMTETKQIACRKISLLRIGALTLLWQRKYCYLNSFIINTQYHNWRQTCFTCSGSKERKVGTGKEHQQCKLKAVILKCTSARNTFIFQRACSLEI